MPSGYTAKVVDGTITEFKDFALLCARAMGATIMMRDEPPNAPIPEFQPNDYHEKAANEAKMELEKLLVESPKDIQREYDEYCARIRAENQERVERHNTEIQRYGAMLDKVEEWEPPTRDHDGLKDFMKEQLRQSLSFCTLYQAEVPAGAEEWRQKRLKELKGDIKYHTAEYASEVKRTAHRNEWVKALRKSLS